MSFWNELKRRNVFRVGIAYALVAWVVLQIVDFLTELIDAPSWVLQVFFIAATIGLLTVLIFSWVFEMTPEGLKRETDVDRTTSITPHTGRKLDRVIIVFLAVAVAFLLARPYWQEEATEPSTEHTAAPSAESPGPASPAISAIPDARSVAVLPFVALSSGEDDEYFADGLTEEILNSLAQLPELLVTGRTSAFAFKGEDRAVQDIAETLGVAHVVEGSVRRAGDRIRVTAQLVRANDGFQLWSDTYDGDSKDTILVQEDIATEIATALDVVMDEEAREAMRQAGLRDPAAYVAFQKGLKAFEEAHGARDQIGELLAANRYFDDVLDRVPGYPPALLNHADAYVHILNDDASEEPTQDQAPPELRDQAFELAVADLSLALENARSLDERNTIEFDLAAITGDFFGIRSRVERYLAETSCEHPSWVDPLATVFGYAAALTDRLEHVIECDPLWATVRFSQIRAALWAGDIERALSLSERARGKVSHPWIDIATAMALIADGRFESAQSDIQSNIDRPFITLMAGTKLLAAQGDRAAAEQLVEQVATQQGWDSMGGFFDIQFNAAIGDRAEANRLAAQVDSNAYGPLPLVLVTMWCACGAPFDLEATPNFAASLEQGNLPWPPPSPIDFPLKDW